MSGNRSVGVMSTSNIVCGIAEHTTRLVEALEKADVSVRWFSQHISGNDQNKRVRDDAPQILRCFNVPVWDQKREIEIDRIVQTVQEEGIKVFHVQYESCLFATEYLNPLLEQLKQQGVRIVFTFHSSCIEPLLRRDLIDVVVAHTQKMVGVVEANGFQGKVVQIPMGVLNYTPVVATFGFRTDRDVISSVCEELGYRAVQFDPHSYWEPNIHTLINAFRAVDVIVLWYPKESGGACSSAFMTAVAIRRPIVINDCEWFDNLPSIGPNWVKVHDVAELKAWLYKLVNNDFITLHDWKVVAAAHVSLYFPV